MSVDFFEMVSLNLYTLYLENNSMDTSIMLDWENDEPTKEKSKSCDDAKINQKTKTLQNRTEEKVS